MYIYKNTLTRLSSIKSAYLCCDILVYQLKAINNRKLLTTRAQQDNYFSVFYTVIDV